MQTGLSGGGTSAPLAPPRSRFAMKIFSCQCGNQLYFNNTLCVACGSDVGFCHACYRIAPLTIASDGSMRCGHADCGAVVVRCRNYAIEDTCNGLAVVAPIACGESPADGAVLCQSCQLTETIPDLTPESRTLWARLEHAKRRVLYSLHLLAAPIGSPENDLEPKLRFAFLQDGDEPVYTGHADGLITINIKEADDVERERARVAFGEPQRTLVGHFRHELGHYYWDLLVRGQPERERQFRDLFGDERAPTYAEAKDRYYAEGPPVDWRLNYISAYATMHPWEDFAECFGAYLDMVSVLDTAHHVSGQELRVADCRKMLVQYQQVGIVANELNREMGLKDLVPEVFGPAIVEKLCWIHRLLRSASHPEAVDTVEFESAADEPVALAEQPR